MHVISAPIADNPVVAVDLLSEQEAAARKRAQEEQDERLARWLSAGEEKTASRKRAQEEEDERLARQCAAEEAEGSKRGGVQASDDFDAFETPASLEQKRLCGRSGVAGASVPPPSTTPRRTRSYTRQQPSVRGRSPKRGRGRRSMMDWFSSADFSGGDI